MAPILSLGHLRRKGQSPSLNMPMKWDTSSHGIGNESICAKEVELVLPFRAGVTSR